MRRNITEGKPGLPLRLELRLLSVRTCEPIPGASFDVWHCDALGVYSGYTADAGPSPGRTTARWCGAAGTAAE